MEFQKIMRALFSDKSYPFLATVITFFAFAFSLFLIYVQAKVLKEYCFYCLVSAGINFLIFLNIFAL